MGEFLHAAGTAAAGAMLARRAAHTAGTVAQSAGKTGQAAVRGVQTQVATWQGAGAAINEMDAFKGMSGRQKFMAQMGAFATMTGERIKNNAVTLVTGNQSRMDGKGNRPHIASVGEGHSEDFHNKNGTEDFGDAREEARKATIRIHGGEADEEKKKKDDDKPAATASNEKRV
jgi:hypothetical protein